MIRLLRGQRWQKWREGERRKLLADEVGWGDERKEGGKEGQQWPPVQQRCISFLQPRPVADTAAVTHSLRTDANIDQDLSQIGASLRHNRSREHTPAPHLRTLAAYRAVFHEGTGNTGLSIGQRLNIYMTSCHANHPQQVQEDKVNRCTASLTVAGE